MNRKIIDSTLNQPLTITDARGITTTFTYDDTDYPYLPTQLTSSQGANILRVDQLAYTERTSTGGNGVTTFAKGLLETKTVAAGSSDERGGEHADDVDFRDDDLGFRCICRDWPRYLNLQLSRGVSIFRCICMSYSVAINGSFSSCVHLFQLNLIMLALCWLIQTHFSISRWIFLISRTFCTVSANDLAKIRNPQESPVMTVCTVFNASDHLRERAKIRRRRTRAAFRCNFEQFTRQSH
jgi:hypothetical protein